MKPNNQKKVIAITGGIASGKSTVAQFIRNKGYPVFSCDEIYKDVCNSKAYKDALSVQFGNDIFTERGDIDRKKLSKLVFADTLLRDKLNRIAHPLIMKELSIQIHNEKSNYVFAEIPLLFEGGYETQFDDIIVVIASRENRIEKLMQRDGLTKEAANKRIDAQFDYDSPISQNRMRECNVRFIVNNGSFIQLKMEVEFCLKKYILCQT